MKYKRVFLRGIYTKKDYERRKKNTFKHDPSTRKRKNRLKKIASKDFVHTLKPYKDFVHTNYLRHWYIQRKILKKYSENT